LRENSNTGGGGEVDGTLWILWTTQKRVNSFIKALKTMVVDPIAKVAELSVGRMSE
jgi:hypothetical protein